MIRIHAAILLPLLIVFGLLCVSLGIALMQYRRYKQEEERMRKLGVEWADKIAEYEALKIEVETLQQGLESIGEPEGRKTKD